MKLYHSTSSPNSRRVRMFIAEKGISIPLQSVNLGEKEQFSNWFKAINPRQQVPALVLDDGTTIAEVPAIWRFLEETFPEHPLLGDDATSKALVTMWERRVELDGFAPTMEGVRNASERLKGRAIAGPYDYDQIPALVERSRLRVKNLYADLDTRLAARPFIAGDQFSAADITGVVTVDFATKAMSLPVSDEHKALRRWFQNVSSRPSAAA